MIATITLPRWPIFALIVGGAVACGSDLLLPEPPGGGNNVALSKVDGDGQTGTVGEELPNPLVLEVRTSRNEPASGREVAFEFTTEAGVVTPSTAVTNGAGRAIARWELGTLPGSHTVRARMADVEGESPVAEFTAHAGPGAPSELSAKSPTSRPGRRGEEMHPVIQVVDRFGNPVPLVSVAWSVRSGEGTVSEAISVTDPTGSATVTWTLGGRRGVQRLTAAVGPGAVKGSPVTFTATVLF